MMRCTPGLVITETSWATSIGSPLCARPPTPEYSPSEFSRNDHPVEFRPGDVAQRAGDARQNAGRAHVGVLIERLADREPQAPKRDVVGDVRCADGPEQDRVEVPKLVGAVLRHHDAMFLVVVGPPVEIL